MQHHGPLRNSVIKCKPAWWASTLDGEPDNVWIFWEAFWKHCLALDLASGSQDTVSEPIKLASCFYLMFIKLDIEEIPKLEELASPLGIDPNSIAKYWRTLLNRYSPFEDEHKFSYTVHHTSKAIAFKIPLLYTFHSDEFFTLAEIDDQRYKGKIKLVRKRDRKDVTNGLPENKEEYEVELLDKPYESVYTRNSEQRSATQTFKPKLHVD